MLPQGENEVESFIPVARIADMLLQPGARFDYNGRKLRYPDTRLIYWCGGNPFHHHQDLNRLVEAWQRPDTVIVHEPWWNALARHADIVLPAAHHMFEKYGFLKSKQNMIAYATFNLPIVKPLWDVKMDETEVPWMLAEKLAQKGFRNLLDYYKIEFKDPETGKAPGDSMEFSLFALKKLTQPMWSASQPPAEESRVRPQAMKEVNRAY